MAGWSRRSVALALTVFLLRGALAEPGTDGANRPPPDTALVASAAIWPTAGWQTATPASMNMDGALLRQARSFALTGSGSGMITRSGKLVMSWGDLRLRYQLKSTTKSIGVTALGLALQDGVVTLAARADQYLPGIGIPPAENAATGWTDDITILHLATHTAGFAKPGGYEELRFAPGTAWFYSDGGANWLADVLTVQYGNDLRALLFSRVFGHLGIKSTDLAWRNHAFREPTINGISRREFGSGIQANVDAMARIGYLYLRRGNWQGLALLPEAFVDQASHPVPGVIGLPVRSPAGFAGSSNHYGLLWWNNGDGALADVPRDAFWAWGLQDSLIIVIPSLDIVVSRAGQGWRSGWNPDYSVLKPFIVPIVKSVRDASLQSLLDATQLTADDGERITTDTVVVSALPR